MASLQTLKDDVLHCVLDLLAPSSLPALARTCRRLARICRARLWHTIDVDVSKEQGKLFERALREKPDLGTLIANLTLKGIALPDGLQERADTILNTLTNVDHLILERPWNRWNQVDARQYVGTRYLMDYKSAQYERPDYLQRLLRPLTSGAALRVRRLELISDFTASEILDIIALEGLESLRVIDLMAVGTALQEAKPVMASFLRELTIIGSRNFDRKKCIHRFKEWQMDTDTLHHLISTLDRLETLEIWLPYTNEPFSAAALTRALQPLHSHLKRLILTDLFFLVWDFRLDERLCLRDFCCLEHVEAMSVSWFATNGPADDRLEVVKLLPPSLIELKILFDLGTGAFFTPREALSARPEDVDALPRDQQRWGWIHAIVSAKASTLPRLSRITIKEETTRKRHRERIWKYSCLRWSPTVSTKERSVSLDVAIEAVLRVRRDDHWKRR